MKTVVNYWCPNCKEIYKYTTKDDVVPANMVCLKCNAQVWKRDTKEVADDK